MKGGRERERRKGSRRREKHERKNEIRVVDRRKK